MADYTTLAQVKALLYEKTLDTNASDDVVFEQFIDAASAYIDAETGRTFVSASATKYFDVPEGPALYVDDFTSLTSVTNGDGTTIATTDITLLPGNVSPKYALRIKPTSSAYWSASAAGDTQQVIAVVAYWGYSAACPTDIRTATEALVINLYQSRRGMGAESAALVTGAGVMITPKAVPAVTAQIIDKYKRRV
jgi:hypothetical protein